MRVAAFVSDVTPPIGGALGLAIVPPTIDVTDRLTCRGVILLDAGDPIVMCALDWIGVAGSGHLRWRTALAEAAGTTPDRVAVHALHQHDAPGYDPDAEELMAAIGRPGRGYDPEFVDAAIRQAQAAVRAALGFPSTLTHVGAGTAPVHRVASNRRVLGPDGAVVHVRYSADRDPIARTAPEGIIDPLARVLSFWDGDRPVAALSYYATHPQSHYRERLVTCDFVGLARNRAQSAIPAEVLTHFNGPSGNVTAGKYNDGSPAMRDILADRLADGFVAAFEESARTRAAVAPTDVEWRTQAVALPLAPHLADGGGQRWFDRDQTFGAAREAAWAQRCERGTTIDLACLRIGDARVLHLPGELFIEYQLAAQALRPESFVATAAYSDYAPGYVGTQVAYPQGGYETGPASRVAPEVEDVLFPAIASLLGASPDGAQTPSDITATAPRLSSV
jgi:hypothetical protein